MKFFQNWNQYNEKTKRKYYFIFLSLFFIIISLGCFGYFLLNGKSFFWMGGGKDGLAQNYNCLIYFSQHLRNIFVNIFINHTFVIPQWDFAIGYGADIMTTMSIMTIGDIFNWPSVFVPEQYIQFFYHAMGFIRLYLAGIAFSCFCFKMNQKYSFTFIGAIIYMFCGYVLISLPRQVVFINPMIWLPLLLIGVEKILHKEKPYLYIFTIFVSIIGSFQYFYILCITIFIYTIVRFFYLFKDNYFKNIFYYLSRFIIYTLIGVLIGSFIFVPVIIRYLGDARSVSQANLSLLYSPSYYKLLPASMISYQFPGGDWTILTFSPIVLISTILLLTTRGKKYLCLKIMFLISILFILTPLGGLIMNGFSFPSNRWIFVVAFLFSFVFVFMGQNLLSLSKFQIAICSFITIIYICYCVYILGTRIDYTLISLIVLSVLMIFLMIFYFDNRKKKIFSYNMKFIILLIISIGGVISNSFFVNSDEYKNYTSEFLDYNSSHEVLMNTGIKAIKELNDFEFYRYEDWNFMNKSFYNSGLNYGVGGPNYFFSLSNSYTQEFYNQLSIGDGSLLFLQGLDSRKVLNSLASVKYISAANELEENIPKNGYKKISSSKENSLNTNIYENTNVLPLGYTYSESISERDFKRLSLNDKQNILLDKIVLKTADTISINSNEEYLDYKVIPDKSVKYSNGHINVTKKNSKISLVLSENLKCDEAYITFENLQFSSNKGRYYTSKKEKKSLAGKTYYRFWQPKKSSIITVDGKMKKNFVLRSKDDIYFNSDKREYSINIESLQNNNKVDIYFSEIGDYSFNSIRIEPMIIDDFEEKISLLKENKLENIEFLDNTVKGNIGLDKDKILCLSIPYTDGWQLLVDGDKTEILQGNMMYMAIPLKAGEHTIELSYQTPGLKLGGFMTIVGFISLITFYVLDIKRRT